MSERFPVCLILRAVGGEGNILVQSRGVSFSDVNLATDEFAHTMAGISASLGAENPNGPHHGTPSFVSGTIFVGEGLFRLHYRLINQVYVMCMAPPFVSSTLCGNMLQLAVQTLAAHAKALDKLGVETVVKFYPEIYLSFRTIVLSHGEGAELSPDLYALFTAEADSSKRLAKGSSTRSLKVGRTLSGLHADRVSTEGADGMDMIPEESGDYAPAAAAAGFEDEDGEDGESGRHAHEGAAPTEVEFVIPEGLFPSAAALAPDPRDLTGATTPEVGDVAYEAGQSDSGALLPPGRAASGITSTSNTLSALRGLINSPTDNSPPLSPRSSVFSGRAAKSSNVGQGNEDPFASSNSGFDAFDTQRGSTTNAFYAAATPAPATPAYAPDAGAVQSPSQPQSAGGDDFDWGFLVDGEGRGTGARPSASPQIKPRVPSIAEESSGFDFVDEFLAEEDGARSSPPVKATPSIAASSVTPPPVSGGFGADFGTDGDIFGAPSTTQPPVQARQPPQPLQQPAGFGDFAGAFEDAGFPSAPSLPITPTTIAPPTITPSLAAPQPLPRQQPAVQAAAPVAVASVAAAAFSSSNSVLRVSEKWTAEFQGRAMQRASCTAELFVRGPASQLPQLLSLSLHGLPNRTLKTIAGAQGAVTAGPNPATFYVYSSKLAGGPGLPEYPILRTATDAQTAFDIKPAKAVLTVTPVLPKAPGDRPASVLVALQLAASPDLTGLRNVEIITPPLPEFLGTKPARCTPRAQWDESKRVLKWSILLVRGGMEAVPRVVFDLANPEQLEEALGYFNSKFYVEATFSCSAALTSGAKTLCGVGVSSFGSGAGPVDYEVSTSGRIVARPAFLLPPAPGVGGSA